MSYSFAERAPTRKELDVKLEARFAQVLKDKPNHEKDLPAVKAHTKALLDLITPVEGKDFSAQVSGWISWNEAGVMSAQSRVQASLITPM